jgi:SAM-dependent methyltransferase
MNLRPSAYDTIDFDSAESSLLARKIMRSKKCLKDIYSEIYQDMMRVKDRYLVHGGTMLEIGSGGGFIKDIFPEVVTSDVKVIDGVDLVLNAETLPFPDNSVSAIFAVHVIHHIPDITVFLREAERVLVPGGGIVCVEPYWSPVARFVYKHMHPEPYDEHAPTWLITGDRPMSSSNQALSYLLLRRDNEKFSKLFPDLELVYERPFGFIRYMATGGVWLPPKVPEFAFGLLKILESLLRPIMPLIAIHHIFVWKKIPK